MRTTTLVELAREAYGAGRRLVAPLMGFPGVEMIGSSIKIAQQNFGEHYKAVRALVDAYAPDAIFPLMDLAVEANALGRYTIFPQNESATVPKDHFGRKDLERLSEINITFDSRLAGYVETVKMMSVTLPTGIMRGAYVTGPFTLAGLMSLPAGWLMLRDYQKSRIETILNPSSDPLRTGYQTIQSKIAVGSGKFLGKGFKQGSQSQLGFLPARHTDFVFAVIAEERGFVGSMTVTGLLLLISIRLLRAAREAKDKLGTMVVAGTLALFMFHVMINMGMVVGLLPIAGIPLPFVSAGGSALISFFAAMGLSMNVNLRRFVN